MRGADRASTGEHWVTVSDLAEYGFCPRAYWYGQHPPREGPAPGYLRAIGYGRAYHQRTLSARDRRERSAGAAWVGLLLGIFLLGLVVVLAFGL